MLKRIATITFLLFALSILTSVFAATSQSNATSGTKAGYGAGSSSTKSGVSMKHPTTHKMTTTKAPVKYKKSARSHSRAATMGKGPSTRKHYRSYTTKRAGVTYKCYPVRKHRVSTPARKAAGPKKTKEYCPKL